MLNCQHHISWVRQVDGGLHQCILCTAVVTKKDVYPKLEDLPEEFRRRWDEHEATRPADAAAKPATANPTATSSVTATPTAPSPRPSPPLRGGEGDGKPTPPASRISAPPVPPVDPHPGR